MPPAHSHAPAAKAPHSSVDELIGNTADLLATSRPLGREQRANLITVLRLLIDACMPPAVVFRGRVGCMDHDHEADVFDIGTQRVMVCQHCGALGSAAACTELR